MAFLLRIEEAEVVGTGAAGGGKEQPVEPLHISSEKRES